MPSLAAAAAVAVRQRQAVAGASLGLDLASTFYVLNPSGDLAATQAAFEERFVSQAAWEVSQRYSGDAGCT